MRHIARNIDEEITRLQGEGFVVLNDAIPMSLIQEIRAVLLQALNNYATEDLEKRFQSARRKLELDHMCLYQLLFRQGGADGQRSYDQTDTDWKSRKDVPPGSGYLSDYIEK